MASVHKVPTRIKKLRGTDRADRDPENQIQPQLEEGVPEPPQEMGVYAKELWKQTCLQLYQLKMLTKVGLVQIEQYCNYYQIYKEALAKIDNGKKAALKSGNIVRINPYFSVMRDSEKAMKSFEDRYGLNPSAAAKLPAPDSEEKDFDEFEDL